tara:strand:- start:170 stop:607 length:438 start_codon:yes stop_codon:yes gene_type:complete
MALLIGFESNAQIKKIDTLKFHKDMASLNSTVLTSLSKICLMNAYQLTIINAQDECDSVTLSCNNCLFQRRAETLKSFFISQGIDSTRVVICSTCISDSSTMLLAGNEFWIKDIDEVEGRYDYDQIAFAVEPKKWHKKTGPFRGR